MNILEKKTIRLKNTSKLSYDLLGVSTPPPKSFLMTFFSDYLEFSDCFIVVST